MKENENINKEYKQITVKIDKNVYKEAKKKATDLEIKFREAVELALKEWINASSMPEHS